MPSPITRYVVLFGPQSTKFEANGLNRMREVLSTSSCLQSLHDDILHFERFGKYLEESDPDLRLIGVIRSASLISDWMKGRNSEILKALTHYPNVIATPLTVIHQILLCFQQWSGDPSKNPLLTPTSKTTLKGLCIGQLTATAARLSSSEAELARLASTAVRLAFCIGSYVDLDRHNLEHEEKPRCLVVACCGQSGDVQTIQDLIANFNSAYVSVCQNSRVTVTVGEAEASALTEDLIAKGFQVKPINLFGRFHCSAMSLAVQKILNLAKGQTDLQLGTRGVFREMLESILSIPEDWGSTLRQVQADQKDSQPPLWYSIGSNSNSPSLAKELGIQIKVLEELSTKLISDESASHGANVEAEGNHTEFDAAPCPLHSDDAVAITGMACKFAGAESLEEFWRIIETGTTMYRKLPKDRFPDARFQRRKFLQNFKANMIDDVDAFDHKFFGISSREAAFMDPQQRLGLQVLYQALESSGYFAQSMSETEKDIGCYVATCMNEYAENVATHPPSAFSLTGSIRPFIAGKFSYHFGWTGPSIMYDTACSASGTAIHQACRAVASGECKGAVAGGTNIFVSPDTFQNLAAGHFTSPTGGSKSFDAAADGYCRGEGVAFIVLKKLSEALQDGDPILGVLAATAVGHNANELSITVPHGPSQMQLYRKALKSAGLDAQDVSYVEAHGTGTPVGDPIEAASIAGVFGNISGKNHKTTYLGSVKSSIGHTEATSGLSALIKVLLMMQKGVIPQQALFNTLNPAIAPLEPQGLEIPTRNILWTTQSQVACINNYGASGTNAVMVVTQPPDKALPAGSEHLSSVTMSAYPVLISAFSPSSLTKYCSALLDFVNQSADIDGDSVMDVAYNLSFRMNLRLPYSVSASVSSIQELKDLFASTAAGNQLPTKDTSRPVVLFFGGQTGNTAQVPRVLYDSCAIFRKHLDDCDMEMRALGAPGIFPSIFEPVVHDNVVLLHAALFSGQYASAMAWLDCGLRPARLIGHSFGQLTALCVAGVLSLHDGLRLVIERARLIEQHMQADSGSMIAIEADLEQVSDLLTQHGNQDLEIACYNGPKSFVLAGSTSAVESFEAFLNSLTEPTRWKKLQVNHAYHSTLTEPLVTPLQEMVEQLDLQNPSIALETCSKDSTWQTITPALIASHIRQPVYFHQAVERISDQLGSCTWLEAGRGSGSTMLRRTLGAMTSSHEVKFLSQDSSSASKSLADVTAELWKLGVGIRFWPFHPLQQHQHRLLNLPPYQFDKPRFWLDWKQLDEPTVDISPPILQPTALLQLMRKTEEICEFQINTQCHSWQAMCSGHRVVGVPTCPLSSILDLVAQAIEIMPSPPQQTARFTVRELTMQCPVPAELEHGLSLTVANATNPQSWKFTVANSSISNRTYALGAMWTTSGRQNCSVGDFARFQRLLDVSHLKRIADHAEADSMKGKAVYRSFETLFSLPGTQKGVKEVSVRGSEVIGYLELSAGSSFLAVESCIQVPLIFLNCLHDRQDNEVCIDTSVGEAKLTDGIDLSIDRRWIVYSKFSGLDCEENTCDIFVFDAQSEQLSMIILDVTFTRLRTDALQEALSGTTSPFPPPTASPDSGFSETMESPEPSTPKAQNPETTNLKMPLSHNKSIQEGDRPDLSRALFDLLVHVADVDPNAIRNDVSIEDLGIDSLMSMDVAQEINNFFSINIDANEIAIVPDVESLCQLIAGKTTSFSYKPESGLRTQSDALDTSGSDSRGLSSFTSQSEPLNAGVDLKSDQALEHIRKAFDAVREEFDVYARKTGCDKFSSEVHPQQDSLIISYIIEAFEKLGCDLSPVNPSEAIPNISYPPRNEKLMMQLMRALHDDGLIAETHGSWTRTSKPLPIKPSSSERFEKLLSDSPQFAPEHKLLHAVGSKLDECLSGALNPLTLLFGSAEKRKLMADQYLIAPIQSAASQHLSSFIKHCFSGQRDRQPIRVLEVGGGTCGTSLHAVEAFARLGVPVEYTFSDISPSFVREAKSKMGQYNFVKYQTLDITKDPAPELRDHFDMIFATNTIHATHDASKSTRNARQMLRVGGFLALVECTLQPYYCLDIIFGQLDGWWAFDDGRDHALMDVDGWKTALKRAGFAHVDWTGSQSPESKILRIILAY